MGESGVRLLVCTVGGSADPIVFSIDTDQPEAVLFVVSAGSKRVVDEEIHPRLRHKLRYCDSLLVDPDRLSDSFRGISSRIRQKLREWQIQPDSAVADITGGTKAMASGLALAAAVLGLRTRYVSGSRPGGIGTVDPGTETFVDETNPFDLYAVLHQEEATRMLAEGFPGAAARVLEEALRRSCSPELKARIEALAGLFRALAAVDRFVFGEAKNDLGRALSLIEMEPRLVGGPEVLQRLRDLRSHWLTCGEIVGGGNKPQDRSMGPLMLELIANARRRRTRREFDTAVACLYRATEMFVQDLLWRAFGANRGRIAAGQLSAEALKWLEERGARPGADGSFKLGLALSFDLLRFGPEELRGHAATYEALKGHLEFRNASILAHGVAPVDGKKASEMEEAVLLHLGIGAEEIPDWPGIVVSLG
ncbi:MAG: TIGR02710 family CRISPR-associated CARF protein [Fimbriimonadaceae bacterium]